MRSSVSLDAILASVYERNKLAVSPQENELIILNEKLTSQRLEQSRKDGVVAALVREISDLERCLANEKAQLILKLKYFTDLDIAMEIQRFNAGNSGRSFDRVRWERVEGANFTSAREKVALQRKKVIGEIDKILAKKTTLDTRLTELETERAAAAEAVAKVAQDAQAAALVPFKPITPDVQPVDTAPNAGVKRRPESGLFNQFGELISKFFKPAALIAIVAYGFSVAKSLGDRATVIYAAAVLLIGGLMRGCLKEKSPEVNRDDKPVTPVRAAITNPDAVSSTLYRDRLGASRAETQRGFSIPA